MSCAAALGTGTWALRKKPQNLTGNQRTALAVIAEQNKPVYKGYLIKEQLREALKVKGEDGRTLLRGMIAWAHRCRIPEFVKIARTLSRFRDLIYATLDGGPSNGGPKPSTPRSTPLSPAPAASEAPPRSTPLPSSSTVAYARIHPGDMPRFALLTGETRYLKALESPRTPQDRRGSTSWSLMVTSTSSSPAKRPSVQSISARSGK
jgi:hypothetical protein